MVVVTGGMGGAAAGSVGVAGGSSGTATFPGAGNHGGWEEDDMSYPGSGSAQSRSQGGFDYQGKQYDPILNEPMAVSAETHGDFWEDDMDHSETVSYEGVETRAGHRRKQMKRPVRTAQQKEK